MEEVGEKQKYELWWEYLKESDKYKYFCDWYKEKPISNVLPWPDEMLWNISSIFYYFGNVHENSFEDWWETKGDIDPGFGLIEYDKKQASYEIDNALKVYEAFHGREPTLAEFKDLIIEKLFDCYPRSFLFRFYPQTIQTTKDLAAQFSKLVRGKRELPEIQKLEKEFKMGFFITVGKFRYDALKRYLKVYRLYKSGMEIYDIIAKLDPDEKREKGDWEQDIRHAKTIIANVEDGFFPGKYYFKKSKSGNKK